jgi:Putative metallopeptidase
MRRGGFGVSPTTRRLRWRSADLALHIEESPMRAVFLILVITWMILAPGSVTTAQAAAARANQVNVNYVPPKNAVHQAIYEKLKEVSFLEKLQKFLAPFRLPRALLVKVAGCDGDANAFYEKNVITVCYEYIEQLRNTMPTETTVAGVTPVDAVVDPLFDTCLHEFAHALFEMLQVPVLGREEDAADQVSAYIMLHLGKVEARRLIGGVAYAYKTEAVTATTSPAMTRFADVHGTPAQRFYNVLCIAYGADKQLFGYVVERGYLPNERAEDCEAEYRQAARAYEKLIGPHVDRGRAKKVFDRSWLRPTVR